MDTTTLSKQGVKVQSEDFFRELAVLNMGPFVGVPCSLISSLIAWAVDHPQEAEYVNPAHESHAMAYAAGTYMATQKIPLVFMQNSGFMNIFNPLTSLHQMYDIPAVLLVTWRGEEGYGTDAPEHWIVGENMEEYFRAFKLPYRIVSPESWQDDLRSMKEEALKTKKPTVLCIKKGLFETYERKSQPGMQFTMTSANALLVIKQELSDSVFLSTTGMLSRESYTAKDTPDFYMMGSMGLISAIATGCARHSTKRVVAIDGDGAIMMHMGILPFIGNKGYENLLHIVIDNEAYSSTKGQPTVSSTVDLAAVAMACHYVHAATVQTNDELKEALKNMQSMKGPLFLHVKVRSGNDHHIGRVSDKYTCPEITERFMENF